jgi:hypothetical protein
MFVAGARRVGTGLSGAVVLLEHRQVNDASVPDALRERTPGIKAPELVARIHRELEQGCVRADHVPRHIRQTHRTDEPEHLESHDGPTRKLP